MDGEKKEKNQSQEAFKQFIDNRDDQTKKPGQKKEDLLADKVVSPEYIPPGAIPPRPFGTRNNQRLATDRTKNIVRPGMGAVLGLKFNNWADEMKKNKSLAKDSITPSQEKANAMLDSFKGKGKPTGKTLNIDLTPNYSKVESGKNPAEDIVNKQADIDIEPE